MPVATTVCRREFREWCEQLGYAVAVWLQCVLANLTICLPYCLNLIDAPLVSHLIEFLVQLLKETKNLDCRNWQQVEICLEPQRRKLLHTNMGTNSNQQIRALTRFSDRRPYSIW